MIYGYHGSGGHVVIPAHIDLDMDGDGLNEEHPVTSISGQAFYQCTSLTSVTIPNSVTSIGEYAFYTCTSLTSVTIPNSVTSIGNYAFSYCTSLTSVTIPNSVTSIENWTFAYCTSLTSVTISEGVTSIGDCAFAVCTSLTSVTIPNSVTIIRNGSFDGCTSLTSVTIPNSVTSIGDYAFFGCSSMASVTIPNSVTSIGDNAFAGCSMTSITIPNSVTSIGDDAFSSCTSLTSVTIGNGATSIGRQQFLGCTSLTSVSIGNGVTSIGDEAFYQCNNLTSVTIPNSVMTIGSHAFFGCHSLISVTIGNAVRSIENWTFAYCASLTSVAIGNSVKTIGGCAFFECINLTSVIIPGSVTSIGTMGFYYCPSLIEMYFGGNAPECGDCWILYHNSNMIIHFICGNTGFTTPTWYDVRTTCSSDSQPSITIKTPNGGETWITGEQYDITWESQGNARDTIDLDLIYKMDGSIIDSLEVPDTGKFQWTVPDILAKDPKYVGGICSIRITVMGVDGSPISNESDQFRIIKHWTVMNYIDGDNDLEWTALANYCDITFGGYSEGVNVVTELDLLHTQTTYRYWIGKVAVEVTDLGVDVNMGCPCTLSSFTQWAVDNYPSEYYALILNDHGEGWEGVCFDDHSNKDSLSASEIETAISSVTFQGGEHINVIGFDACLMATIDNAYALSASTDYLIFSEEVECGSWPYAKIQNQLISNPKMSPYEFGSMVVFERGEQKGYWSNQTLSCVATSEVAFAYGYFETLAQDLRPLLPSNMKEILEILCASDSFAKPNSVYYDLVDFAEQLKVRIPELDQDVDLLTIAVNALFVKEWHGNLHPGAHGLSFYCPPMISWYDDHYETIIGGQWASFLRALFISYPDEPASYRDAYEPDDDIGNATFIGLNISQTHSIGNNGTDQDWLYFILNRSTQVIIRTEAIDGDTELTIHNHTGIPLFPIFTDGNPNEKAQKHVQTTLQLGPGTYYIMVDAEDGKPIRAYDIALYAPFPEEAKNLNGKVESAAPIEIGTTINGSIGNLGWDKNWFTFTSNRTQNIKLETWGSTGDTLLALCRGNMTATSNETSFAKGGQGIDTEGLEILAWDDDSGTGQCSCLYYPNLPPGTYYILVYSPRSEPILSYSMNLTTYSLTDDNEPDGTPGQASVLVPGPSPTHSIGPNGTDEDWYVFTISKASNVTIETMGAKGGDTRIWLYDSYNAQSNPLAFDDDSGVGYYSKIGNVTLSPGTYYVKVRSWIDNGTVPEYSMNLAVLPVGVDNGLLTYLIMGLILVAIAIVMIAIFAVRKRRK